MPLSTSFAELPSLPSRSPRSPYQFARMPNFVVGWAMIAGVHSTVWILAISAALIRRALSNSCSSVQSGCSAASRSAIALCSRHEERVQERQAEPEVAGDAGEVELVVEVARELAVVVEPEPAALVLAERLGERGLAAVDLGAVPPVRVGRRRTSAGRRSASGERVVPRPFDAHRPLGPRVVGGQLELEGLLGQVLAVAEPVVHLELDPGAGEHVHDRGRLELVAGQELAADEARARLEQVGQRLRIRAVERARCGRSGRRSSPSPGCRGRCRSRRGAP